MFRVNQHERHEYALIIKFNFKEIKKREIIIYLFSGEKNKTKALVNSLLCLLNFDLVLYSLN